MTDQTHTLSNLVQAIRLSSIQNHQTQLLNYKTAPNPLDPGPGRHLAPITPIPDQPAISINEANSPGPNHPTGWATPSQTNHP
ncbi:hypothetical protein LIER_26023 [Lithospermum erythrorhizon]|uniref:Uncharacterized protein n=1 Tax=Lithospermum erythrorhizon TaxID=34254 RepID=A0AAV3RCS1_LITER